MSTGLEGAPFPGPWSSRGACRSLPPRIFFPTRGEDHGAARAVCSACPVVAPCRDYALGLPGLKGIWGGLSEHERDDLRHRVGVGRDQEARSEVAGSVPRPARAASGSLLAALEVVATRPGSWARVARFASVHSAGAVASLLRRGRRATPPGRWRFEARRRDDGTSELWACFEGLEQAAEGRRGA